MAMDAGFMLGIILGCLIIGALYGLVPLFVGKRRDLNGLGVAGFFCSMLGNLFFMGWGTFIAGHLFCSSLSPVVAIVFTVIILIKSSS